MTIDEIRVAVLRWDAAMRACDEQASQLIIITMAAPESPLLAAIYGVMGAYTKLLAEQIGWDEDALTGWWLEHNFGERPMRIGFAGEPLREIRTAEELADFICEDLKRAA